MSVTTSTLNSGPSDRVTTGHRETVLSGLFRFDPEGLPPCSWVHLSGLGSTHEGGVPDPRGEVGREIRPKESTGYLKPPSMGDCRRRMEDPRGCREFDCWVWSVLVGQDLCLRAQLLIVARSDSSHSRGPG